MWSFFSKKNRKKDGDRSQWDPDSGTYSFLDLRRRDPLTNLPNRQSLEDYLGTLMLKAQRKEIPGLAVLFLDLDRFRKITTGLGYRAADQLLHAVADRLSESLVEGEFLGRFAADQFVLIIEGAESIRDPLNSADRLKARIREPFLISGTELFITISGGAVLWDSSYTHAEELIRNADIATTHAKSKGHETISVFDPDWQQQCAGNLQLQNELRRALNRNEFEIFYQPIVSLADGRIAGFEALSRWQHPTYGLMPPAYFIGMAEESGSILEMDRKLLENSCRQLRTWHTSLKNFSDLYLSVNVSSLEFLHPDLISRVDRTLRNSGTYGRHIRLELTESLLMENTQYTAQMLDQLRALHIGISIDDFGTGYSSFAYLKRFAVDTIKIDYSFVQKMIQDEESAEIVRSIAALADNLGKSTVAEGVETKSQYEALRKIGVDSIQGFFIAPPLNELRAGELLSLVQDREDHLECILEERLHHPQFSSAT